MIGCQRGLHQYEVGAAGKTPGCKQCKAEKDRLRNRRKFDEIKKQRAEYRKNGGAEKQSAWLKANPENTAWSNMRRRCNDPENQDYHLYGGRGIKVCERWNDSKNGYANFLSDMGRKPSSTHSIDRIDTNGDYEPLNCRWATIKVQQRNRRSCKMLTWNGKTQCVKDWAEELGLPYTMLVQRIGKCKWPIEKALTTPVNA